MTVRRVERAVGTHGSRDSLPEARVLDVHERDDRAVGPQPRRVGVRHRREKEPGGDHSAGEPDPNPIDRSSHLRSILLAPRSGVNRPGLTGALPRLPLKLPRESVDANRVPRFGLPRVRFRWRRLAASVAIAVWSVALGVVAFEIYEEQRDSRRQLEQRFAIRADSAARFIETYAREVIAREQAQATMQLAGPHVTAAIRRRRRRWRLPGRGAARPARTPPADRPGQAELIGQPVGPRTTTSAARWPAGRRSRRWYPRRPAAHRSSRSPRRSTRRRAGACSAARSTSSRARSPRTCPVSARSGRAPSISSIPTGGDRVKPRPAADGCRRQLTAGQRAIAGELRRPSFPRGRPAGRRTPWRLVVTVPETRLYAPLSTGGGWLPWGGLAIFVLASLLVALLVVRLLKTRNALVADIAQRRASSASCAKPRRAFSGLSPERRSAWRSSTSTARGDR